MHSLRIKLILILGTLGSAGILLFLVASYFMALSGIVNGAQKDSENLSDQIAYSLQILAAQNDSFALQRVAEKSSTLESVSRIIIVDTQQVILAHTDQRMIGQQDNSPLFTEVLNSGRNLSQTDGMRVIFIRPLHGQSFTTEYHDLIGALWVEIDITQSTNETQARFFEIGSFAIAILLLGYITQYLVLKKTVIDRIFEIEKGIRNALRGELGAPVTVVKSFGSEDEINALAQSYNYLTSNLVESQAKLKSERDFALQIMESMGEGLTITNADGIFEYVNPGYAGFLGLSPKEIIGRSPSDFMNRQGNLNMEKEWEKRRKGLASTYEARLLRQDGSELQVLISSVPRYLKGKFAGSLAVITDISDRARIEEMTAALQRKLIFEELTAELAETFMKTVSSEVNNTIQKMLGKLGGLFDVDRTYIFEFDANLQTMNNTYEWCASGVTPQIEVLKNLPTEIFPWWMEQLKKGETIIVPRVSEMPTEAAAEQNILTEQEIQSVLVTPIRSEETLFGFLGLDSVKKERQWSKDEIQFLQVAMGIVMNTITRLQAEENLRLSESRNRAFLDAVPDLIFRIDANGTFLDFRADQTQNLFIPPDQIIGSNIENTLPKDIARTTISLIQTALETNQTQKFEYQLETAIGTLTYDAHIVPSSDREVIVVSHDISERAQLEQMKTDFINRASHELRTPLTTAILMAELLEEEETNKERTELFSILRYELDRQRQLLNDLLTAARIENGRVAYHLSEVEIPVLVEEAIATVKPQAEKRQINVEIETEKILPVILTDRQALHQILLNLLSNAIKFSYPGGQVVVHIKNSEGGVLVSVQDFGIGIPSQDMEHITTRFFRAQNATENEIQGTGIGLFIVNETVKKLKGHLQIESVQDEGSTMHIWLPANS